MLESLPRRPRARALAARLGRGEPGPAAALAPGDRYLSTVDPLARALPEPAPLGSPISLALHERLGDDGRAALRAALIPEEARLVAGAASATRAGLELALGVHHAVEPVLARTGLRAAMPPEDVHATARGPLAAGGAFSYADLVAGALEQVGAPLRTGQRVLDFGSSSGRVVRVLAAARGDVHWHGCDPNAPAIAWAQRHLPGVAFSVSPQHPPLPFDAASFDVAYAISIWSHFGEPAALDWLAEMERVLAPGGVLLLTFHSWSAVHHYAREAIWDPRDVAAALQALYASGAHFINVFGARGDWGVSDPAWGVSLFSGEWLAAQSTPRWRLLLLQPGGAEGNQDVAVLQRR